MGPLADGLNDRSWRGAGCERMQKALDMFFGCVTEKIEFMTLKMDMDANKVELLMRAALLEDAANISERFGAITAEINVLDDDEVWIALDTGLWPEDKYSPQVEALAKLLWLEIEWEATMGSLPFAWPGLGEYTNITTDYFKMVLDAYGSQKKLD